jgi:hypothetical protein
MVAEPVEDEPAQGGLVLRPERPQRDLVGLVTSAA